VNLRARIQDLFDRLGSYPTLEVLAEYAVIWMLIYLVVRFVQGTRAAGAIRGVLVLIVILFVGTLGLRIIGGDGSFQRLGYLADRLFAVVAIGLVVIFQPELRRALSRLGETPMLFRSTPSELARVVDEIVMACSYLSKSRFGALIVLERQTGLGGLTEGGARLDAAISTRLLQTIFFPGTALHDLAVVIRGSVVHAAGVQLPLAEPEEMPDPALGSRHRAAVGLTKECDALVVVVSEETGAIRLSERGSLSRALNADELRQELRTRMGRGSGADAKTAKEAQADANLPQERKASTEGERLAG